MYHEVVGVVEDRAHPERRLRVFARHSPGQTGQRTVTIFGSQRQNNLSECPLLNARVHSNVNTICVCFSLNVSCEKRLIAQGSAVTLPPQICPGLLL